MLNVVMEIKDGAVKAALQQLGEVGKVAVLEDAARSGALVIEAEAKTLAPVKTGNLRRSIHTETVGRSSSQVQVAVGTDAVYAAQVEYGGIIVPKRKRMLAWQDQGGVWHFARRVSQKPHPYMRPAFDAKSAAARAEAFAVILKAAGLG